MYLNSVAANRGSAAKAVDVFQSIKEAVYPGASQSAIKVIELKHTGSSDPGVPPIRGTGKCYYILSDGTTPTTIGSIKNRVGLPY